MNDHSIPCLRHVGAYREAADVISGAAFERAIEIAQDVFIQVARDIGRTPEDIAQGHFMSIRSHLNFVFRSVLRDKIEAVLSAATITPEMLDMQRAHTEVEAFKDKKRKLAVAQMRKTRGKLRKLKAEIRELESRAAALHANVEALAQSVPGAEFRCAPMPSIAPTKTGESLPRAAGIYFVWLEGSIVYVGKSTNLKNRVTLAHQNIYPGDMLSFIECDPHMLDFTESMYIGAYMPRRNFNGYRRLRLAVL